MKKNLSTVIMIIAIVCFMALAIASGSSDEPTREPSNNSGTQSPSDTNDNQTQSNDDQAESSDDNQSSSNDESQDAVQDERFSVGDTATFSNLKITAEEIILNDTWKDDEWSFFEPSEGKMFVAVKFTIENISNDHQNISSILLFDAYADGVKLEYSFGAAHGLEGTLDGEIAAGRRMVGYYGAEISENTKELELEVRPNWLANSRSRAMFAFDITALG